MRTSRATPRLNEAAEQPASTDKPSKTQRKAQAHSLQVLGRDLAKLSDHQLSVITMDDSLREAIHELRRTRTHEGRRRQLQRVGKVMRQVDAEPLRQALAASEMGGAQDALALHKAEYWRDALVADDTHFARFAAEHPNVNVASLRAIVRRARIERAVQPAAPGGATRHGKAWRELFRFIRPAINGDPSRPGSTDRTDGTDDDDGPDSADGDASGA